MYYGYGLDATYVLVLIGAVLTMLASARLQSTYAKYAKIRSISGKTGAMVAREILDANGLFDVAVNHVAGNLTDHYNPADRSVNLSDAVYGKTSLASVSVAAHECGHAIQHQQAFAPLKFRSALFPIANIGSQLSWPLILMGLILGGMGNILMQVGIVLFIGAVAFQLITLPVEFDASRRAIIELGERNILYMEEEKGAKSVLFAAALTYVAAAAASILQLLRLILLSQRRRD